MYLTSLNYTESIKVRRFFFIIIIKGAVEE